MTLLRLDGFEGYGTQLVQGYVNFSGTPGIAAGQGRGGGDAIVGLGDFDFITPDGSTNIITGYARKCQLNTTHLFLRNGADALWYCAIGIDAVGRILCSKADFSDFARVDPGMRLDGVWRYYELDLLIHASAGHVKVKIDGVQVINVTGVNTLQARPGGDEIKRMTFRQGAAELLDDMYVCDEKVTGDGCTGFLGDRRMFPIYPNGAVTAAWTPKTATPNYQQVNETNNDGDVSYNSATVVTTEDKHDFQNTGLPGSQEVFVALMTSARRLAESGPRQLTSFFDCGGHRLEGAVHQLSETYYYEQLRMTKHPFTGANLTAADIDAARAGYRLTA